MATITFLPVGKSDNANIYVRLSIDRKNVFKRKTGYTVKLKDWSYEKNLPKQNDDSLKNLTTSLNDLRNSIQKNYNKALSDKNIIDSLWLQNQIDFIQGKKKPDDPGRLIRHFEVYIEDLPRKRDGKKKNQRPITKATITKYKTILNKIMGFEKYTRNSYHVKDVDLNFRREFIKYLQEQERLSENTIGRYITFVKTVCMDAELYNIEINKQLKAFTGYTEEPERINLSFQELEKIENADIVGEGLLNARDWLLIGCHIGQRVSDLLNLTKDSIIYKNGLELIEIEQKKTKKKVYIPVHEKVKEILNKYEGGFPRQISSQKFNIHIKKVAQYSGIDEPTKGAIIQPEQVNGKTIYRKIVGIFPKYELVTSHICRRSFATNYYGEMPTPLVMTITGHTSEAQFLEYVGKPPIDYAQQIAEYFNMIFQRQQNKAHLKVRKAN